MVYLLVTENLLSISCLTVLISATRRGVIMYVSNFRFRLFGEKALRARTCLKAYAFVHNEATTQLVQPQATCPTATPDYVGDCRRSGPVWVTVLEWPLVYFASV